MSGNYDRRNLETVDSIREPTINKQLQRIYLDQERRRRAQDRRRRFLQRWGYICSCCIL